MVLRASKNHSQRQYWVLIRPSSFWFESHANRLRNSSFPINQKFVENILMGKTQTVAFREKLILNNEKNHPHLQLWHSWKLGNLQQDLVKIFLVLNFEVCWVQR